MAKQKAKLMCPGCLRTHPEIRKEGCGSQNCPPSKMMSVDDVKAIEAEHHQFEEIMSMIRRTGEVTSETTSIDDYAVWARSAWMNPERLGERDIAIMSLGLGGETGEVLEILKKRIRDDKLDREHLKKELGDVLFYWIMLCNAFDLSPTDVMNANVEKVNGRRSRGTLQGSGDDR